MISEINNTAAQGQRVKLLQSGYTHTQFVVQFTSWKYCSCVLRVDSESRTVSSCSVDFFNLQKKHYASTQYWKAWKSAELNSGFFSLTNVLTQKYLNSIFIHDVIITFPSCIILMQQPAAYLWVCMIRKRSIAEELGSLPSDPYRKCITAILPNSKPYVDRYVWHMVWSLKNWLRYCTNTFTASFPGS